MSDDSDHNETEDRTVMVPDELDGARLDKALAIICQDMSRSRLKDIIESGNVRLDGRMCDDASHKVMAGQAVSLSIPEPVAAIPKAEEIPLNIVHEDDDLLVINKQAGLVVHPGAGNWNGTLVNALLWHCGSTLSGIGGVFRPGIVHRLDKETSGLMVVAKSDVAHRGLSAQLENRSLSRTYSALVWKVTPVKGVIDKPIARSGGNRIKMGIPLQGGKEARTHYRRAAVFRDIASMVECDLETGRTHQIRVHMQSIGHPLLGDPLYGLQRTGAVSLLVKAGYDNVTRQDVLNFPRQALHAAKIRFNHPVTGETMEFSAGLPNDMTSLISALER